MTEGCSPALSRLHFQCDELMEPSNSASEEMGAALDGLARALQPPSPAKALPLPTSEASVGLWRQLTWCILRPSRDFRSHVQACTLRKQFSTLGSTFRALLGTVQACMPWHQPDISATDLQRWLDALCKLVRPIHPIISFIDMRLLLLLLRGAGLGCCVVPAPPPPLTTISTPHHPVISCIVVLLLAGGGRG